MIAYGKKDRPFSTVEYIRNRAARILPLYYTAMILMLVYYFVRVNILKTPSNYNINGVDTILNGLLVQAWIPQKAFTLNPPAWSLSVEVFFYLSFPFILNRVYGKLSLHSFVKWTVIVFIFSQALFHFLIYTWPEHIYFFYFLPLLRINEFLAGIALGALFIMQKKPLKNTVSGLIILIILSIIILRINTSPVDFHNGLFAIFFVPMLYLLANNQGTVNRIFSKKSLIFLGEISYGVYIFQFPVYFFFTSVLTYFGYKISPPLFYVYLLILLIVSAICHVLIELPLRKRIRKLGLVTRTTASQSHL